MTGRRWEVLVAAVVFTLLGLAGGWFAARQTGPGAEQGPEGGHGQGQPPKLSPATLKNLGVSIGTIRPTTFVRYREIPAVVVATPSTEQPVYAPIGGRILEVRAEPGLVVAAGTTVATLVREPLPRPSLTLTGEILRPATEEIHRSVVELRKAKEEVRIARTELERVEKFTGKVAGQEYPILPKQRAIDLRYQLSRAQKAYERADLELKKHGFTDQQIELVAAGGAIPRLSEASWKRALERNGLWPRSAAELCASLPAAVRNLPWAIATVGELAASGLATPHLTDWLQKNPGAGERFLELGAMLQRGYSLSDLQRLYRLNALGAVVEVVAPGAGEVADWDVHDIHVKPGAKVEAGTPLLTLLNPRMMYLRTEPVGGEVADLLKAISAGAECKARPLVAGSGPTIEGLTIGFITGDDRTGQSVAYADVKNEPLAAKGPDGGQRRSWKLRSGLKYVLRIPVEKQENVYVLPSDAVTDDGPHKVVFLQDGDTFRPVEVEIGHRDHEVVVIPINERTEIFPDDPVVLHGAFALGLALTSGGDKLDPHAGHKH
jgi:multidrug efflux pump subunit AcrA (membrane-fusion protein)